MNGLDKTGLARTINNIFSSFARKVTNIVNPTLQIFLRI